jgi:hypothetical protein
MIDSKTPQTLGSQHFTIIALLVFMLMVLASCDQSCPDGLQSYKGKCLSRTTIEYVGCTEGRGINPLTKVEGTLAGDLRVVANASLQVAYEQSATENTPVALQIIKDCLELAKNNATLPQAERASAANLQSQVDEARRQWEAEQVARTPTLELSTQTARKGARVTVIGTRFQASEMVGIRVHATLVTQVRADENGRFSTVITVPQDAPPPNFGTTISATGQTSARSAQAPFRTQP